MWLAVSCLDQPLDEGDRDGDDGYPLEDRSGDRGDSGRSDGLSGGSGDEEERESCGILGEAGRMGWTQR
ncbi:hypothetical protein CAP38_09845 [Hydrogenophaga sp. IBVHS2]|nr:hypothetical protein CAP38_09845 [Hydrogenophaga sp. IBVHS2]